MARPKEQIHLTEAFEQRCQREKDRLRENIKKQLKNDIVRLLTEEIHPDIKITDGIHSVLAHKFILQSRADRLLEDTKENISDNVSMTTINIPQPHCLSFHDFTQQLYYTENVNSLLDEVLYPEPQQQCDDFLAKTRKNKVCDEWNHNTSKNFSSTDTVDNIEEISLNDVNIQLNCPNSLSTDLSNLNVHKEKDNINSNHKNLETETENDLPVNNLPDLIKLSYSLSLPHECCSCLGQDLLRGFLQEKCCDCSLVVAGQQFKAHRCILASRSEYFEAMLGGQWKESDLQNIELEGINPGAVEQALLYLYGGVVDIIETCNIPDLLLVGDMYGMIGLKDIASYLIKKDYCHFFHKPCSTCCTMAGDALTLAVTYNLDDLKDRCIKWINKYFTKFWSARSFATQHEDILKLCCDNLISQISKNNVIDIIMDTHKLNANLPRVKWSEPIMYLTVELMNATLTYISQNFVSIMGSKQFLSWEKGAAWNASVLEEIFGSVIESVSPSNGCKIYQALLRFDEYNDSLKDPSGREDLHELVKYLVKQCEHFLKINIHQVTLTEDWAVLPENIRTKILDCASYVCIDNNKVRKRPPKLNSNRKAKVPGAVIQSLREDHQFKKMTAELQKSNKQTSIGAITKRHSSSASSAKTRSVSKATCNKEKKTIKSEKDLSRDAKTKKENRLITNLKLETCTIPDRHLSSSSDPEASPSPISGSISSNSRIPIHRQSSLSPFQGRSHSASPEVSCSNGFFKVRNEPTAEGNQNKTATFQDSDNARNNVVKLREKRVTKDTDRRWSSPITATNDTLSEDLVLRRSQSVFNGQIDEPSHIEKQRLLPLFEVEFHQPKNII